MQCSAGKLKVYEVVTLVKMISMSKQWLTSSWTDFRHAYVIHTRPELHTIWRREKRYKCWGEEATSFEQFGLDCVVCAELKYKNNPVNNIKL